MNVAQLTPFAPGRRFASLVVLALALFLGPAIGGHVAAASVFGALLFSGVTVGTSQERNEMSTSSS